MTGLPTEIKEDRLGDKLCIHFQRARNGGGEVVSVNTVKTPDLVLVTFEDSKVAQRVIQQHQHILEVDGKKYNLIVTDHGGNQNQDKVIIHSSATVDCSQLSGAKRTLKGLQESHPDVQMKYSSNQELCTLSGSYSKVQAVLAQLVGHPERPHTAENKDSRPRASSDHKPVHPTPLPRTQVSGDQSRSPREKREQQEGPNVNKQRSSLNRDITPGGYDWEDTGQVEGATASCPASDEDFSLMVDADMFRYLQKHCSEEYHQILRQHGVAVVDFTHQGLTTLLLQVASGDDIQDHECLRKARMEISRLYEKNQANICREKLAKMIIPNKEGRKRAMEKLSGRFPKIILNEDDQNIYFIGSRDDVNEAKQFLLLHDDSKDDKTDVSSPRRLLDSLPADEGKIPIATSSTSGFLDYGTDQVLRSGEDESRADTASKYKLAAQFKDSRLTPLGSKTDFTVRGVSHSNRQTRQGPMLGYDVLSDTKGSAHVKVSAQNLGGDILFKSGDVVLQNKTSWTTDLEDTRSKGSTVSSFQSGGLGNVPQSPAMSGSSLRRTSSFSGTAQKKNQEISPKSPDDSDKTAAKSRGRSSSFSNGSKTEQYSAEITVNNIMWRHIAEAYKHWIEEKTSGVQLREKLSEGSGILTLVLTGTNSTNVTTSQLGLQKIIDSVGVDFSIQKLPLSKLGVTNTTDETLQACCTEIRSLYKKITLQIADKSLYLLGPEPLCSQVCASLQEVFSGAPISKHEHFSRPSTSSGNDSYSNSPLTSNGQTGKAAEPDGSKRRDLRETELVNGSISQLSPRKDPVIREKVRRPATVEMDAHNTQESVSLSKSGNIRGSGTVWSDKSTSEKRQQSGRDVKAWESTTAPEGPVCICKKVGVEMKRTDCGVTLCSDCLDTLHRHCRVCEKKEPTPSGIQGKMTYSKLPMSVPGFFRDPAFKITYCIPDGIQGKDHPSPGQPFKGGVFEAYLPDSTMTRKLLPRLQEAFNRGFTFTVLGSKVIWDGIPHKTSLQGGRSTNGYPDSSYLRRLSEVLTSYGIE